MTKEDKKRVLSILNAWKKDGTPDETCWHITDAGWYAYANHTDAEIRAAARNNPFCYCLSRDLQQRRIESKLNVRASA